MPLLASLLLALLSGRSVPVSRLVLWSQSI